MRVLLLSSFFPPDTGGIETYAYNFAVALQTEGHYVKVVCGSREISEVPMQHEELYKGIPVVRYCAAPGPFVDWPKRFSSRYNQVEIGDEFDVVFILNVSGLEFAVSRFNKTPKVYIVPTVFHYASNYIVRHVDPSMKGDVQKIDRQITRIEKKAIPFIDFFVTLSKNVKDQFIEY
ncbi:MAG: glycosyltransferase, partial [Nanoarchaeota archaeon]|nr:glycosyltransferase [Nanoarchaeota archaeon]